MLATSGKTIVRALYYDFSNDEVVVKGTAVNDPSIVHQYMFGTSTCLYIIRLKEEVNGNGSMAHCTFFIWIMILWSCFLFRIAVY